MKIVAKPIEMIAWFKPDGGIRPIRFRMMVDDEYQVIPISQIISIKKEKLAGNEMFVFDCQSKMGHVEKRFEVKYEVDTCQWMLYKI